jgi:hypothetical protein
VYKKVVKFSFAPMKNILVFSFWFQFIQQIEHLTKKVYFKPKLTFFSPYRGVNDEWTEWAIANPHATLLLAQPTLVSFLHPCFILIN